MELPKKPKFEALKPQDMSTGVEVLYQCVPVPSNRVTPLKKAWETYIYKPIRDEMKIDIRMNLKKRMVELMSMPDTPDMSNIQKCAQYLRAIMVGFDPYQVKDAFLDHDEYDFVSFHITDVRRTLKGEHLARAIGRICGKGGKTKFTIENTTKTRIVVAGTLVHICGSHTAIKIARDCISCLIMGSPAGSIYSRLRIVAARASERF